MAVTNVGIPILSLRAAPLDFPQVSPLGTLTYGKSFPRPEHSPGWPQLIYFIHIFSPLRTGPKLTVRVDRKITTSFPGTRGFPRTHSGLVWGWGIAIRTLQTLWVCIPLVLLGSYYTNAVEDILPLLAEFCGDFPSRASRAGEEKPPIAATTGQQLTCPLLGLYLVPVSKIFERFRSDGANIFVPSPPGAYADEILHCRLYV